MSVRLFTSNFWVMSRRTDAGVPVRISNGRPKYALAYSLVYKVPALFPAWSLVRGASRERFRREYFAALDAVGVEALREVFEAIAKEAGDDRLVLLCFENLTKPGVWCHRELFAEWWQERTGEVVEEVALTP